MLTQDLLDLNANKYLKHQSAQTTTTPPMTDQADTSFCDSVCIFVDLGLVNVNPSGRRCIFLGGSSSTAVIGASFLFTSNEGFFGLAFRLAVESERTKPCQPDMLFSFSGFSA